MFLFVMTFHLSALILRSDLVVPVVCMVLDWSTSSMSPAYDPIQLQKSQKLVAHPDL